jgi:hypothetical protein
LILLAILSIAYLALMPRQGLAVDAMFALLGLGVVGMTAKDTRERVWGPPAEPVLARLRHCAREMVLFTVPGVLFFGGYGAVSAYLAEGQWGDLISRLFQGSLLVTLVIYIPWAWVQQTLFQFYLLGRLRALCPGTSPLLLSSMNAILFGAVHLPAWDVTLVAMVGGVVWSSSYDRHRSLPPLALSHGILGATYFSWVRDSAFVIAL